MRPQHRTWVFAAGALVVLEAAAAALQTTPVPKSVAGVVSFVGVVVPALIAFTSKRNERRLERADKHQDDLEALLRQRFRLVRPPARLPRVKNVAEPERLGVHPARAGSETGQPPYVDREVDARLDGALRRGGLVVVHGPSAAGKSRTAYEAVRRTLPNHRLLVPADLGALSELVRLGHPLENTVVWLIDRLFSIERSDQDVADVIAGLLPLNRNDVVVVVTMWDELWGQPWAKGLQAIATSIPMAAGFTPEEIAKATEVGRTDPRIADAIAQDTAGPAEHLAAGPAALDKWRSGRNAHASQAAVGAAIVSAAVDLWLAGYSQPVTSETLERLHRNYLRPQFRADPGLASFDAGLGWAVTLVVGASSCLIRADHDRYYAFDYLVHHARGGGQDGKIPDWIWDELATLLSLPVSVAVGTAALEHGRHDFAEVAARLGTAADDPQLRGRAFALLGEVQVRRGEEDGARESFTAAAELGNADAAVRLGDSYALVGDAAQAQDWYEQGRLTGSAVAVQRLAAEEETRGHHEDAGRLYEEAVATSRAQAAYRSGAPRPTSLSPYQLGFVPRPQVPWFSPSLMAGNGVVKLLRGLLGQYLDRRSAQGALPSEIFDHGRDGEVWLDYVAALGDGFNATYSVAYLLGQRELTVEGFRLPRGEALVMGGGQVYPTASDREYQDRTVGPYRAALPVPPRDGDAPTLYALPGDSDARDGSTAFLQTFASEEWIGGWRTRQPRSYFAVRLPARWWLLAIDLSGAGTYLDAPQRAYFRQVSLGFRPGDRVVVCVPRPSWVDGGYDGLDRFIRQYVLPTGAACRLLLAGGRQYYARYTDPEREYVTCGGGGTFVRLTDRLPERIEVPPRTTLSRESSPPRRYELAATYPTQALSRRLAWSAISRLPQLNPGFVAFLGALQLLLMFVLANSLMPGTTAAQALVALPVTAAVLYVGAIAFALPDRGPRRPRHWIVGSAHGTLQLALGFLSAWLWVRLPVSDLPMPLPVLAAVLVGLPILGLAATALVGGYLMVANGFGVNSARLSAAVGSQNHRSFLRIHVAADGSLTLYPLAVDRVSRLWRAAPDGPPDAPWIEPAAPLAVRLIEEPVRIN